MEKQDSVTYPGDDVRLWKEMDLVWGQLGHHTGEQVGL